MRSKYKVWKWCLFNMWWCSVCKLMVWLCMWKTLNITARADYIDLQRNIILSCVENCNSDSEQPKAKNDQKGENTISSLCTNKTTYSVQLELHLSETAFHHIWKIYVYDDALWVGLCRSLREWFQVLYIIGFVETLLQGNINLCPLSLRLSRAMSGLTV